MTPHSPAGWCWRDGLLPAIALAFMLAVRLSIGPVLGLGFVPLLVAPVLAIYVPWRGWVRPTVIALLISLAAAVPLLGIDTIAVWLQLAVFLTAAALVTSLAAAVLSPRISEVDPFAQTAVVLLWLAWITWPIWLANAWSAPLDHLLNYNPLNVVGSLLADLGDWTHQPIAYNHLLGLGQDVPYEPAASAWPAIIAHAVAAAVLAMGLRLRSGKA